WVASVSDPGNGIFGGTAQAQFENTVIAANHAALNAAVYVEQIGGSATAAFVGCTVTGNVTTGEEDYKDGAIGLFQGTLSLLDTIVWGNLESPTVPSYDVTLGIGVTANLDHSDVGSFQYFSPGAVNDLGGNVSVDPQLLGYHLTAGSP